MTAKQEIKNWRNEFGELKTDAEKEAFKVKVHASLAVKNEAGTLEGLKALKSFAKEVREKAELMTGDKTAVSIQVFPTSEEDKSMLENLLTRLNIPFKFSS